MKGISLEERADETSVMTGALVMCGNAPLLTVGRTERVDCTVLLLGAATLRAPLVLLAAAREVSTGGGGGVGTGASIGFGLDSVRLGGSGPVAVVRHCSGRMRPASEATNGSDALPLVPIDVVVEGTGITGGTGGILGTSLVSVAARSPLVVTDLGFEAVCVGGTNGLLLGSGVR